MDLREIKRNHDCLCLMIKRHLVFRDYLLAHPDEASRYSQFKEELAREFAFTSGYSPAKNVFVSEMEKRALAWYQSNMN